MHSFFLKIFSWKHPNTALVTVQCTRPAGHSTWVINHSSCGLQVGCCPLHSRRRFWIRSLPSYLIVYIRPSPSSKWLSLGGCVYALLIFHKTRCFEQRGMVVDQSVGVWGCGLVGPWPMGVGWRWMTEDEKRRVGALYYSTNLYVCLSWNRDRLFLF